VAPELLTVYGRKTLRSHHQSIGRRSPCGAIFRYPPSFGLSVCCRTTKRPNSYDSQRGNCGATALKKDDTACQSSNLGFVVPSLELKWVARESNPEPTD
jgi:hypothetical protein